MKLWRAARYSLSDLTSTSDQLSEARRSVNPNGPIIVGKPGIRRPCAGRSVCITASLALKSTEGSSACNWLSRWPRAEAVCVPLRITPRLFFSPRCMASSSDKSIGCAETSPVATLP